MSLQFTVDVPVHFGGGRYEFQLCSNFEQVGEFLDVLTDPPTNATVDTFEGFLFAMCRARCNTCER